jgi:hypothetical protein
MARMSAATSRQGNRLGPPCILQREFTIAACWHGLPRLVRAPHRGLRCMGNLPGIDPPTSAPRRPPPARDGSTITFCGSCRGGSSVANVRESLFAWVRFSRRPWKVCRAAIAPSNSCFGLMPTGSARMSATTKALEAA